MDLPRRGFLAGGTAMIAAGLLAPLAATASLARRRLSFHHTHTNQRLSIVYFESGEYVPGALARIERFLGDFRTGDTHPIDPVLLDILHEARLRSGSGGTFEVISAYRSPRTNAMLAGRSTGVATRSLHVHGRAIDVRLSDVDTSVLRDTALAVARGGVGYYPRSGFVHFDTGHVRRW